ncbi:helix-turn-helix domain-containing protein [Lysobacter enzymogenes]|nr:helix-turn-helix transcriptional regulator [Lysobacter enzymogenes]QCW27548.1 helix-turn-helix transcriptional regulator [Lysobacter enzymogenes]QQQ00866.1 helix-turn-helix transcriptional regulator [Lysobacter enzymogenes]UZW61887.1 helix-turn-helix transcriptional regulator [Lysobacter enzymogenes]
MSKKTASATRRLPRAKTKPPSKKRQSPPSELLQAVGARIREVRKQRGYSQDDLAYGVPMDRAYIGLIENGKSAASIITLVKLAIALECEVGDLFPYIEDLRPYAGWLDE